MGRTKVQIQLKPADQFPANTNVMLSRTLAKRLRTTDRMMVRFGSASAVGRLALTSHSNQACQLSDTLQQQLHLPSPSSLHVHVDRRAQTLRLGPLLGILVDTLPTKQAKQKFGALTNFLTECAKAGKNFGIAVAILLPQTLNTRKQQFEGWVYTRGSWQKTTLPLPDVIYNRIGSRSVEMRSETQAKLQYLRHQLRIPIFNETFLNKWQVHRLLQKDAYMQQLLPATQMFHKQQLQHMWQRYPVLYLKPTNGSLGQGIIRLVRTPQHLSYQSATNNGTRTVKFRSFTPCLQAVSKRIGQQSYLMQRGLSLATHAGRSLDFRVLAQKNESGNWTITSTVARIANSQHIVSNLARGGMIRKSAEVLREISLPNKPSLSKLKATALFIAQTFERLIDGHFAELGIDLALDQQGKLWLIELNSKPSKTDDSILNPATSVRPSVNRLLNYVQYLTGIHPAKSKP